MLKMIQVSLALTCPVLFVYYSMAVHVLVNAAIK